MAVRGMGQEGMGQEGMEQEGMGIGREMYDLEKG